jgi:hypothetical protein
VVVLVGQPKYTIFVPGAMMFKYDVPKLIAELAGQPPANPPPSKVAEDLEQRLAPTMRTFKPTGVPIDDLFLLVAGIEANGTPSVWYVQVIFKGGKSAAQIKRVKSPVAAGLSFPAGYGFLRSEDDIESAWRIHAPKSLGETKPPYDLEALGKIAAQIVTDEKASNPAVRLPVREVVIKKGTAPIIRTLEKTK